MGFRFLNISVVIHPSFWLFLVFFGFGPEIDIIRMLILSFVMGFSLLFHEYGHGLAALRFGKNPEITLEAFGGYTSYRNPVTTEKESFFITLCGPLFTALLIAASYFLLKNNLFTTYWPNFCLYCIMNLNIYWLIINLAPLNPLDGGQLLGYLLRKWFGNERGYRVGLMVGNVTAVIGTAYFFIGQSYIFGSLFLFFGWRNFMAYKAMSAERTPTKYNLYNLAVRAMDDEEYDKARTLFQKLARSKDEYFKKISLEGLASILEKEGNTKAAYDLLIKSDAKHLNNGKWLLCKMAYSQKNYSLVTEQCREIYDIRPTYETAILISKAFSQLDQPEDAIGWLKTSLQFEDAKELSIDKILDDEAFNAVRDHALFQEVARDLAGV